jgi:hypothetical protein
MAFWDFFSDKPKEKLPPGKKTPYHGDLAKTAILQRLFQTPKQLRDQKWIEEFLVTVPDAAFRATDPQVAKGPDGFPYFILFLPHAYQTFEAYTIRHMKDDFLLSAGYGIIINPKGSEADWVFSYGDVVNFHIAGEFYSSVDGSLELQGKTAIDQSGQMAISQPSESYLPKLTRSVLRDFLKAMGVDNPKIMLVTQTIDGKPVQELAFNVYPQDFPTTRHYDFTVKNLAWYLPRHYTIMTIPKNNPFEKNFTEL